MYATFAHRIPVSTRLDDVLRYLVDSSLLVVNRDPLNLNMQVSHPRSMPMPGEAIVPDGFLHCIELLFYNVGVELSRADLKKELRERFKGVSFTRFRTIYYHGRYSVIVTLDSDRSAYFVYWHFKRNV